MECRVKTTEIMDRAKFLWYGYTMIFQFDFSDLPYQEAREVAEYGKTIIAKMPKNYVLTLTNVTNVMYDDKFNQLAEELAAHNKPYVLAGAVIGVPGWREIVYRAALLFSGRDNLKLFSQVESAKAWLAGYGEKSFARMSQFRIE
jgi:hypothetical protein